MMFALAVAYKNKMPDDLMHSVAGMPNTQLSGVAFWREYRVSNIRDRLLRPSDGAEGGGTASTACYVAPPVILGFSP